MRIVAVVLVAVMTIGAGPTTQPDVAAAKAKMAQRVAAREADDNTPSTLTRADERALRKELDELRAEVKRLRLATAKPQAAAAPVAVPDSFRNVAANYIAKFPTAKGKKDAQAKMRGLEDDIAHWLSSHNASHEVADGLWRGVPVVGLDEKALNIIGVFQEAGQADNTRLGIFTATNFPYGETYDVAITQGFVSRYGSRGRDAVGMPFESRPTRRPLDAKEYVR